MTISQILGYPRSFSCHLTGTRMRQTHRMLWIGAIFGALFGWIGILVAALFWATLAIFKLIWALTLFAFQALLWVGAALLVAARWLAQRLGQAPPTPAPTSKKVSTRSGLKPKRIKPRSNRS